MPAVPRGGHSRVWVQPTAAGDGWLELTMSPNSTVCHWTVLSMSSHLAGGCSLSSVPTKERLRL